MAVNRKTSLAGIKKGAPHLTSTAWPTVTSVPRQRMDDPPNILVDYQPPRGMNVASRKSGAKRSTDKRYEWAVEKHMRLLGWPKKDRKVAMQVHNWGPYAPKPPKGY